MAGEDVGGVDSRELASAAASAAVDSQLSPEDSPGQYLQDQMRDSAPEEEFEETQEFEEDLELEGGEEELEIEATEPDLDEFESDEFDYEEDELDLKLRQAGIELGVNRRELPEEVRPAYDSLMNQALAAAEAYEQRAAQLQAAQAEINQFAQKMQESPEKILLTLAITQPEKFQEAVSTFEEMQHDPRMRDVVTRELKAEATLSAAQRAQQVQEQRVLNQKVERLTRATRSAAQHYGVDPQIAEEVIADRIKANGGDIDMSEIPKLVSRLRPARPKPRVATKKKVDKQRNAPQKPVEGQGTPKASSMSDTEASPGLTRTSSNPMMDLVKAASRRITQGTSRE